MDNRVWRRGTQEQHNGEDEDSVPRDSRLTTEEIEVAGRKEEVFTCK